MPTTEITIDQEALACAVAERLFHHPARRAYAVLDGASIEELLDKLYDLEPEFECLYRGELAPDLAQCAPYLVKLEERSEFLQWLIMEGWGKHWGIFVVANADLDVMRRHFRRFLMVKDPEGKRLYFRYYDPRVFRVYLPTCNAEERKIIFGPVHHYLVENDPATSALEFAADKAPPKEISFMEVSAS